LELGGKEEKTPRKKESVKSYTKNDKPDGKKVVNMGEEEKKTERRL